MTRSIILTIAITSALAVVAPTVAFADDPTPAQLEKAKKAFGDGKKAFDAGDFPEAAARFKESFNLSKKPALLYNIGLANESAGDDDVALHYYRQFLKDAPADAPQRAEVNDRVKALEKKFGGGTTEPVKTEPVKTEPVKTEPVKTEPKKPIVIKPAGTYSATDFQHLVIDVAPPAKPLDITAFVPEDSGWTVTLFFRTAGEGKFTSKPMKWRYKELVGRIPPNKMIGTSVQYYIEAKDQAGAVVTRSAKSTSPNLVNLEAGATPKFYPDFTEEGTVQTAAETKAQDDEDDPFNKAKKAHKDDKLVSNPEGPTGPATGFSDVGSTKFTYVKWGATGAAAVGIGVGVLFYIQATKSASALVEDTTMCGNPPCRAFDTYDKDLEAAGKRDQTLSQVGLFVGGVGAIVAGYYWYKELTAKKHGELKVSGKAPSPEAASWVVAPTLGDGFAGAAALGRF